MRPIFVSFADFKNLSREGKKKFLLKLAGILAGVIFLAVIGVFDFYAHRGIKFSSIIRAAMKDVFNKSVMQGGSTITQQFIKNSVLTPERTLSRKIKEVILSLELELKFSKDEILGMYLNEIPYGSNAYGIEAAALP